MIIPIPVWVRRLVLKHRRRETKRGNRYIESGASRRAVYLVDAKRRFDVVHTGVEQIARCIVRISPNEELVWSVTSQVERLPQNRLLAI
jgi:hypothetical protein